VGSLTLVGLAANGLLVHGLERVVFRHTAVVEVLLTWLAHLGETVVGQVGCG